LDDKGSQWRDPEFAGGGGTDHGEPITGVWGWSLQQGTAAKPWWGVKGAAP